MPMHVLYVYSNIQMPPPSFPTIYLHIISLKLPLLFISNSICTYKSYYVQ